MKLNIEIDADGERVHGAFKEPDIFGGERTICCLTSKSRAELLLWLHLHLDDLLDERGIR